MSTQNMSGRNECHSQDNLQDSVTGIIGLLPAVNATQNHNTRNSDFSVTPHDGLTGIAISGEDSLNSSNMASAPDQPDCLLDMVIDSLSPPPPPVDAYHQSAAPSAPPLISSDNLPLYSDLSQHNNIVITSGKGFQKPPRYKTALEKKTHLDGSDEEECEALQHEDIYTTGPRCESDHESDQPVLHIGLNLIRACKRLLNFLTIVNDCPELYFGQLVDCAIYRYEHFWLPLLSDYLSSTNSMGPIIAPPIDIHWVWVVHMLAPQQYISDCTDLVGQILPHKLLTQNALLIARNRGKQIWEKLYPDYPWDQDSKIVYMDKLVKSKIKYKIKEAVERQSAFYYQVSLKHYRSVPFLRIAIRRYRQFLHLKLKKPDTFIVPCYDMDLVWHAHQVHPLIYIHDTTRFLGCLLPHDDSVNDRNSGSKLVTSDAMTRKLWVGLWGENFRRDGAMYRGDPPKTCLRRPPREFVSLSRMSVYHIQVVKVTVQGMFPEGSLKIKFRHQLYNMGEVTVKHEGTLSEHNVENASIVVNLSSHELLCWLVVKVAPEKRFGRLLSKLGHGRFWCMSHFQELHNIKSGDLITKELVEEGCIIKLELRASRIMSPNWVPVLTLTGPFEPVSVPVINLTKQTGLVVCSQHRTLRPSAPELCLSEEPSHSPPTTIDNASILDTVEVHMATHRLVNNSHPKKPQLLEVEVSHSRALMFSSIHVYAAADMMPWAHDEMDELGDNSDSPSNKPHCSSDTNITESGSDLSTAGCNNKEVKTTILTNEGAEKMKVAEAGKDVTEVPVQPPTTRHLVALAHTLDPNTLPSPRMLKMADKNWKREGIALCDWDAGERAFIIKSSDGRDWAILVGRWTGLRRGIPGTLSKRGVPGSCGELSLRIYCPVNEAPVHLELPYSKKKFDFVVKNCWVDLKNGMVQVAAGEKDFVENITLGLAVTVLHVLCQPRFEPDPSLDQPDSASPPLHSELLPNRLPVENLMFLAAAGLFCAAAPTNRYRRKLSKDASSATLERWQTSGGARSNSFMSNYPLLVPLMVASSGGPSDIGGEDDGGVGACGACGGCGGCGGGVEAFLGAKPEYLWGNSQRDESGGGGDGMGGGDGGGFGDDGGGFDFGAMAAPFSSLFNSGTGGDTNTFSSFFSTGDTGGGDGGGDGGGCGGCGGCGG